MTIDCGMSLATHSKDLIVSPLCSCQFIGFSRCLSFRKLGEAWGARASHFSSIGIYIFITIWGSIITTKTEFHILAIIIALSQGGIRL